MSANQADAVSEGKHTPDLPLIAEGRFVIDPNSAFQDKTIVECYAPDSAKMASRIAASLNALAGVPEPERAIAQAREALKWTLGQLDDEDVAESEKRGEGGFFHCDSQGYKDARAALALLTAR